jgi:broad specificity phosphatase PhoE
VAKLIYLVRHGQSQGNIEGWVQGLLDSPLSERGREESLCLAKRLKRETKIDLIFTSPLKRAFDTSQIIAHRLACPLITDQDLREYNMGPIAGLTPQEIKQHYPARYQAFERNEYPTYLPGEEGREAFEKRVRQSFTRILRQMNNEQVAVVVSHSGTLNACLRNWLEINNHNQRPFAFANASLSLVSLKGDSKMLIHLNDTCHLTPLNETGGNDA